MGEQEKQPTQERINITVNTPPNKTSAVEWVQAAGVNGVLAVIGVIAICIYGGQLHQMKKATQAAKDSADAALQSAEAIRPRLAIASLTPAPLTPNGFPMDGNRLRVSFELPNYGPVATANVQLCEFDSVGEPNQLAPSPYGNCQPSSAWTYGNPVVPPMTLLNGSSMPAGGMEGSKILTDDEIRGLKRPDGMQAVFSVLAIYPDAAGKPHHAESCVLFTFQQKWGTQSMGAVTWGSKPCPWKTQND